MSSSAPLPADANRVDQAAATLLEEAMAATDRLAAQAFLDDRYDVGPALGAAGYISEARGLLAPAQAIPNAGPTAPDNDATILELAERLDCGADSLVASEPVREDPGNTLTRRSAAACMRNASAALRAALPPVANGS
ncbi:hypothetical protein [Kitasatospora terrestris]|uniref:HEPN domain-containing protein n=1 Tax=Kitasatospora terrestris TaxID=258051 RepID=A0ABP9DDD7_9ACTN